MVKKVTGQMSNGPAKTNNTQLFRKMSIPHRYTINTSKAADQTTKCTNPSLLDERATSTHVA